MTRQELLEQAALILEQEGWLLGRTMHDMPGGGGSRLARFAERYREWQTEVRAYRAEHPGKWPEPPDNS